MSSTQKSGQHSGTCKTQQTHVTPPAQALNQYMGDKVLLGGKKLQISTVLIVFLQLCKLLEVNKYASAEAS